MLPSRQICETEVDWGRDVAEYVCVWGGGDRRREGRKEEREGES